MISESTTERRPVWASLSLDLYSWHGNVYECVCVCVCVCVCKDNLSMSVKSGIVLRYSTNKLAALWFLRTECLRTERCTRAIMTQLLLCLQLATAV